ncbi:MAG: HAMP domain-containing histidine kinase, partial [Sphingobacteriales bacterium]
MPPLYDRLSAIRPLARSYTFKFLFIAFLGIHIPLIGLIVFVLFRPSGLNTFSVLGLTLLLTLAATAITLYILNGLLAPLRRSRSALQQYRERRMLPQLPTQFQDEAGQLMSLIQFTITELNDLLEEKRDMTSLLSHDLRIPLRNVKTFSRLLKRAEGQEEVNEIADMIQESAEEQTRLLEDILEILRQDHLFFSEQQNSEVSVETLLEEAIHTFQPIADDKSIRLHKEVKYSGSVEVQPELFRQVLKNLTSNAIKFSHPGTQVTFSTYSREGQVYIDIKDSGIGFEPDVAERLFDR